MKILRVSLNNLASLAGEAEVDFEGEVLGGAPVFAITGRTGAGKSTLLDAICLALYGKTPRYEAGGGTVATIEAKGDVKGDDERNILRRGAGRGWAEVDFLGRDGLRYRARWEVWRARDKADSTMQPATRSLFRISGRAPAGNPPEADPVGDGADAPPVLDSGSDCEALAQPLTGKKTRKKTKPPLPPEDDAPDLFSGQQLDLIASGQKATDEVEKRLGLSFKKFRHAVLLAQGEFKAFLEAKENERSELLEAITGTGIYSRLSIEAHRRKSEADSRLKDLEQALAGIETLGDEERAGLEAELAAAREREAELTKQNEACRQWLEWFREDDRKAATCDEARRELETVERTIAERGEDFAKLKAWEALEPIRAAWGRMHDLEVDLANSGKRQAELNIERTRQGAELERLTAAEAGARQALEAARLALEAARPELDAARRLDQSCAQARQLAGEAAEAARNAEAQLHEAGVALDKLGLEAETKQAALVRDGAWLAARETVHLALEGHEGVCRRLEELARQRRDLAKKNGELKTLRAAEAECGLALEKAREGSERAKERLAHCREALDAKRETLRGLGPDALRAREQQLQERIGLLERAAGDQAELKRDEAALKEIEREIAETEAARAAAAGQVAGLERARQDGERQARGAREALERLGRALANDLAALRAELQEAQPCPLCGATEHPWADRAALTALGEELRVMRAELQAMEANGEQLASEEKRARDRVAGAEGALGQLRQRRGDVLPRIGQRKESLERTRQALPDGAAVLNALGESLEASRGERGQVAALLGDVRRLEQESEELQTQCEQGTKEVEESGDVLNGLAEKSHDLGRRGEGLIGEIGALGRQLDALGGELREALAGRAEWVDALRVEGEGGTPEQTSSEGKILKLREALRTEAISYGETRRRQREAETTLQDLATRRAAGEAQARGLEGQLAQAKELLNQRNVELETTARARSAVLGGRAADEVEVGLNETLKQARQTQEAARLALEDARQKLSELEGNLRSLAEHLAGVREEWAATLARVEAFAGRERLTLEQIARTLAIETRWLEEARRARETLTREREHKRGQAETLHAQLESHRAAPPPHPREACEARRAELEREGAELKSGLERLVSRLAVDGQNRARLGEKQQELEAARGAAMVWQTLGEAIGSADGKKLRAYAQGLTLRALVAHANAHLRQLRPRYGLRQNEAAPMDLVLVDHDLGGEVRTVRSLSGGESFLVSLALALGLSNMAARDLSIDSLFIDEGFGTLDGDTLQMALAVLQGLHAQGKQVGIISHVEGIAQSLGAEVRVEAVESGRSRVSVRMAL